MAYVRKAGERRLLIVLNFVPQARSFDLSALDAQAVLLLSTHLDETKQLGGEINTQTMKVSSSSFR